LVKINPLAASLWVIASGTPLAAANGVAAEVIPPNFSLPFKLIDNRVFVQIRLNGRGPFYFILDTGADADLSERAARRLGLSVEDSGVGQGVGATLQHFARAHIARVQLGKLQLNDVEFAVTSFADAPQVFGVQPLDGFIGRKIFEHMVVKHDYSHRLLTFVRPDRFAYSGAGTVLHFERPRQIPVIEAKLDGVAGKFGVDTGARSALLLYGPFCEQNKLSEKYGAKLEGVTGWGIGGPVRSLLARAHELSLGTTSVHDPVIRLATQKGGLSASSVIAGLIGPDVLSQFDVTFDYARQRIILEKSRDYDRRDSYDRAGLWMGQQGKRFVAVDVIAGGPADEADVRTGDTILAIDGRNTANLVLPEIRETMRRWPNGRRVTLLLESRGVKRTAIFTLRDLV
jgi:hypothetical protein